MATRPIFIPNNNQVAVSEKLLDFHWFPGIAKSQKQKSITSLHQTANRLGYINILEISSKSEESLGIQLSAFNLSITTKKYRRIFTVETAFQGSKVFEKGGPYKDLLGIDPRTAKKDIRLKESGNLIGFKFFDITFPSTPRTYFYDWLYINALMQHDQLAKKVLAYEAFSDIEFNPKKSINCQAHAAALFSSLVKNNKIEEAVKTPEAFLIYTHDHYINQKRNINIQSSIV